jgi:hypothetical protein
MRDEIGVDKVMFGRDYPHAEGTWPNTLAWAADAFAAVPEDELRLMLGGNAIRLLRLDAGRLARIAQRIGPTVESITGRARPDPRMVDHWAARGGYLKPREQVDLGAIDVLIRDDLIGLGSTDA